MASLCVLIKLLRPYWKQAFLSILFSIATVGSGIGLLGTSAYLISRAALQPSIAELQVAIVGVRFFGISRGIFRYLERLASHSINFHLLKALRVWCYRVIEARVPAVYLQHQSGDLLARVTADVDSLENFHPRVISPPLVAVLVTIGVAVFMGSFTPMLGMILAGGMVLTGVVVPLIALFVNRRSGSEFIQVRSEMYAALIEALQGMAELKAFDSEDRVLKNLYHLIGRMEGAQSRMTAGLAWVRAMNVFLPGLTLLTILMAAIYSIEQGELNGVFLAVFTAMTLASFEAITPMGETATFLEISKKASARLFSLEKLPLSISETGLEERITSPHLQVENLFFRHNADFEELFHELSFDLPSGKRVGLAGLNGAGKTTLFHLLMRLWDYREGSIRLGERELKEISAGEVRKHITMISQSSYLFSGTVRENLLLGRPNASDDVLCSVLGEVELSEWLKALPLGLDTWVGEHGVRLSGGERRRLVIARALLKDASVYLIDEPGLHLDPLTETKINTLLKSVTTGKSVIWVSHHLIDMEWMDEIWLLKHGRIAEQGNYADLMHLNGDFAQMVKVQERYLPERLDASPCTL